MNMMIAHVAFSMGLVDGEIYRRSIPVREFVRESPRGIQTLGSR
jgi:hypothetical protein